MELNAALLVQGLILAVLMEGGRRVLNRLDRIDQHLATLNGRVIAAETKFDAHDAEDIRRFDQWERVFTRLEDTRRGPS